MTNFDVMEANAFMPKEIDLSEKLIGLHKSFSTKLSPENGIYGITETIRDNGVVERLGTNEFGHRVKEYFVDGQITKRREVLGEGNIATTMFDDNGAAYMRKISKLDGNLVKTVENRLMPNASIVKGNYSAFTDAYGRTILSRIDDVVVRPANEARQSLSNIIRDGSYKPSDHKGHLIADSLGGPASLENIIPQLSTVNQGQFAQVENIVRDLKLQGHKVTYEMKANYVGSKNARPSSFEPRVIVDGVDRTGDLIPDNLKKILNDGSESAIKKAATGVAEKYGVAHELGVKSGLIAAGLTFTVSTVDNVSSFIDGEITAEEMVTDIVTETAEAGALGYGTAFISTAVSQAMSKSSTALLQRVGGSCLPAAAVSFAVESYDSISDFAQGKIDGAELAFDLGDNAASIAGGMAGAQAGAMIGSVAGPVGTVAGTLVGGMVGCVVASEAYATAVEAGCEGAQILADKAEQLAQNTIDSVKEAMPEKAAEVADAFNDFISSNKLPISIHL